VRVCVCARIFSHLVIESSCCAAEQTSARRQKTVCVKLCVACSRALRTHSRGAEGRAQWLATPRKNATVDRTKTVPRPTRCSNNVKRLCLRFFGWCALAHDLTGNDARHVGCRKTANVTMASGSPPSLLGIRLWPLQLWCWKKTVAGSETEHKNTPHCASTVSGCADWRVCWTCPLHRSVIV
jgi:hypothetical protein